MYLIKEKDYKNAVFAAVNVFNDQPLVHIRKYFRYMDYDESLSKWTSTQRGVTFSIDGFEKFKKIIPEVDQNLSAHTRMEKIITGDNAESKVKQYITVKQYTDGQQFISLWRKTDDDEVNVSMGPKEWARLVEMIPLLEKDLESIKK